MTQYLPAWAPEAKDLETPSAARMYDFYLGGSHNFAADRAQAQRAMQVWPDLAHIARANRGFLRRSVTYLAGVGIDQFIDLGSGIPTVGNVHEIAQAINPAAVTVYVDADPVAVAYGQPMLEGTGSAVMLAADLRDPAYVLGHPDLRALIDLRRPVGILLNAVLQFVPDHDAPAEIVARYREATAPGSFLAVSHATSDYQPERSGPTAEIYNRADFRFRFRSREQILALLDGYDLLDPGLTDMIHWRAELEEEALDTDPLGGNVARYSMYAAVGRKAQ